MSGLDAEAIFWLSSTIAQCMVALLAFGAFLAVWRMDAAARSGHDAIVHLHRIVNGVLGRSVADAPPPAGQSLQDLSARGQRTVERVLKAEGVHIPNGFSLADPGKWASQSNWRATLALAEAFIRHESVWAEILYRADDLLDEARRGVDRVQPTVRLMAGLRDSLKSLVRWGILAFAVGLAVVAGGKPLAHYPAAGWPAMAALLVPTAGAALAARRLAFVVFSDPDAWPARPGGAS